MGKSVPKNNPTPQMVDYMLSELLKPLPFWKRLGKDARARAVYVQEISKAYEIEHSYGRKMLQLCKGLQELNEGIGEDLKSLKNKVNDLVMQALAEDSNIDETLH